MFKKQEETVQLEQNKVFKASVQSFANEHFYKVFIEQERCTKMETVNARIEQPQGLWNRLKNNFVQMVYKMGIDDALSYMILIVTVVHTHGVLAKYEMDDWMAWPLAIAIDLSIMRFSWVCSNPSLNWEARLMAGVMTIGSITVSYWLNYLHYTHFRAGDNSIYLAVILPAALAGFAAVKSLIDYGKIKKEKKQNEQAKTEFLSVQAEIEQRIAERTEQLTVQIIDEMNARLPELVNGELKLQERLLGAALPETKAVTIRPIVKVSENTVSQRMEKAEAIVMAQTMSEKGASLREINKVTGWAVGTIQNWKNNNWEI
jgi:hypothetical protein